ncbi:MULTISPECIES: DUF2017 family protein [unclassified Microbacterium]|uniref:DUF2017 family protein n=1 Tax=unclassified Microbacterium TaxID=2609290 RepID=UPI001604F291|nr:MULTISPECIES: DUF2017 family protein [unclassified Microbacterium]QNA92570.1 DUF2017 family protein [Microbacterium sp. Se63.02b]QYM65868.1 DUF2017 domain-containing protein [Microbacterium sp. Se5.02b]
MSMTLIEEIHLARLIDDFIELVDGSRDTDDPAIGRLTPSPYPEDSEAAAQFADSTRDDLLERRLADARHARVALDEFASGADQLTEEEAMSIREVLVPSASIDAWLRTLTAIRLVIATRLGIADDDHAGGSGPHDVYEWVGYRLEMIIQAADDADDLDGHDL